MGLACLPYPFVKRITQYLYNGNLNIMIKKYNGKAYVESISQSNEEANLMFKLNFLTLFINTFIESYPMGTSNVKVVNKLVLLKDFSIIDWCGYILHSLRTTKAKWNTDNKLSSYTRPMLVLLVSLTHIFQNKLMLFNQISN